MSFGPNPLTGRSGPAPEPPRDDDKVQARQRVNVEVREGRRPHPNTLPCADCGHVWAPGERRHEYDHHLGYAPENHLNVISVCTTCHARRDGRSGWDACLAGHPFTPENTAFRARPGGGRVCIACRRLRDRGRKRPDGYWKAVNARRKSK